MTVGILALQGDVREHEAAFCDLGVATRRVSDAAHLEGLGGIVLPGGESTTLSLLLESTGLFDPLDRALRAGLPAFGTCAGLVLLASDLVDGRPDQRTFGCLDCTVRRNGYGRQRFSFEAQVDAPGLGDAARLPAVFIRAPRIEAVGPTVEVLASLPSDDGAADPVVLRKGPVLAAAFHPELTADRRLHRLFASVVAQTSGR